MIYSTRGRCNSDANSFAARTKNLPKVKLVNVNRLKLFAYLFKFMSGKKKI